MKSGDRVEVGRVLLEGALVHFSRGGELIHGCRRGTRFIRVAPRGIDRQFSTWQRRGSHAHGKDSTLRNGYSNTVTALEG